MQYFKGDDLEKKLDACIAPVVNNKSDEKDIFYSGAYEAAPLGDLLYDNGLSPLSNAILRSVFRDSFTEIFEAFIAGGTFEAYLAVFRKVFGDDVEVTFTVPDPGKLNIDIVASGLELVDILGRTIENNSYVFFELIDQEGNNIVGQAFKGLETQYELEQMLFEMVPGGIYTQISLTIGGE